MYTFHHIVLYPEGEFRIKLHVRKYTLSSERPTVYTKVRKLEEKTVLISKLVYFGHSNRKLLRDITNSLLSHTNNKLCSRGHCQKFPFLYRTIDCI